jgi:hypothetical protein
VEVRDEVGLFERDKRKTFTFWDGLWGGLVVWGKEDVLDGVGDVQESA